MSVTSTSTTSSLGPRIEDLAGAVPVIVRHGPFPGESLGRAPQFCKSSALVEGAS